MSETVLSTLAPFRPTSNLPRRRTAGTILTLTIIAIGLLLATWIPPSFLAGGAVTQSPASSTVEGYLLVSVTLQTPFGGFAPVAGVRVGIAQLVLQGIRLSLLTNQTGETEFPLRPGQYGVSITDPRFGLSTNVPIASGNTTLLQVQVNRTQYPSLFADLSDSTGSGAVNSWERMDLAIEPQYTLQNVFPVGSIPAGINASQPKPIPDLGQVVFIQAWRGFNYYNSTYPFFLGPEAETTLISQVTKGGVTWLELQPQDAFALQNVFSVVVNSYVPGYSVSSIANN
jgi:hypothetical protein